MAEENSYFPHSIQSLLYVEKNGNYCGYKQELIDEDISGELREFLICAGCKGISRMARHVGGNTVCEMCVTGPSSNLDERVESKVYYLKSKCPLSMNSCDWTGVLGEIEQHMVVCLKVLVECQQECGMIIERETTQQHNNEVCPLRIVECQYCREEIQVKDENLHIMECMQHPDTEIPCPYMALGCDVIIVRKDKDIHLTENVIGHQKLILYQLEQLRRKNQEQKMRKEKMDKQRRRYLVIGIITAIIAGIIPAVIAIAVAICQANSIQYNSQRIEANSHQMNFSSQLIQTNSHQIDSNLQLIKLIQLSNSGFLTDYIGSRRKALPGIAWVHDLGESGHIYGPTFYMGQCKMSLKAYIYTSGWNNSRKHAQYFVQRVSGLFDSSNSSCLITYTHASYGYLDDIKPQYIYSSESIRNLTAGNFYYLSNEYWKYTNNRKVIIRVYFDTE